MLLKEKNEVGKAMVIKIGWYWQKKRQIDQG